MWTTTAVGRIPEVIGPGRRIVVTAPHRCAEPLRDLLGDEVAKNREFVGDVFIDADDFFTHVGWRVVSALERSRSLFRPSVLGNTAVLAAGSQQCRRIGADQARRDDATRPRSAFGRDQSSLLRAASGSEVRDPGGYNRFDRLSVDRSRQHRTRRGRIRGGWRYQLVEEAAIHFLAPFLVIEEESRVIVHPRNFPAEVETENVVAKFSHCVGGGVEIVAGIRGVVAEELPSLSVELLGSGLDHGADLRRGRQAVFGGVVRGHVAELGNRVDRGHDAAARAAAVQVLAAVNQLQVVAGAFAVDADRAVAADRSERDSGTLQAYGPGCRVRTARTSCVRWWPAA